MLPKAQNEAAGLSYCRKWQSVVSRSPVLLWQSWQQSKGHESQTYRHQPKWENKDRECPCLSAGQKTEHSSVFFPEFSAQRRFLPLPREGTLAVRHSAPFFFSFCPNVDKCQSDERWSSGKRDGAVFMAKPGQTPAKSQGQAGESVDVSSRNF